MPTPPSPHRTLAEARNARIAAWQLRKTATFTQKPTFEERQGWLRTTWCTRYLFQRGLCAGCGKRATRNKRLRAGLHSLFCLGCWHHRVEE